MNEGCNRPDAALMPARAVGLGGAFQLYREERRSATPMKFVRVTALPQSNRTA